MKHILISYYVPGMEGWLYMYEKEDREIQACAMIQRNVGDGTVQSGSLKWRETEHVCVCVGGGEKWLNIRPRGGLGDLSNISAVSNLELTIIDLCLPTIKQKFSSVWFYITQKSFCFNKYLSTILFFSLTLIYTWLRKKYFIKC